MTTRERPDPMLHAPSEPLARRDFVKRMGAAIALAGAAGCTRAPREEILPYVTQPPEVRPSRARRYASSFVLDGYAVGILVESHEGRPTKVEGNPDHPASLGASGVLEQASVLGLYDPDRAKPSGASWSEVVRTLARAKRVGIVLPKTSSPAIAAALAKLRARRPELRVWYHGAASRDAAWAGARLAFGRVLEPRVDLSRADVIVALDADLFGRGPACLRLSRQWADRRRVEGPESEMNRLYAVGPTMSPTSIAADQRLRVRAHDVAAVAAALFAEVTGAAPPPIASAAGAKRAFVRAVAKDLTSHRGRAVVVCGDAQPPAVHALAHAMNEALEAPVELAPSPILEAGEASHDLRSLADALAQGALDTLVVLGTNLVYASPADLDLGALLRKVPERIYLGAYDDETARACTITIPEAHALESWGDARAFDGTVSLIQPLIEPLHDGKTGLDVLAALDVDPAGEAPPATAYELVRRALAERLGPAAKDATLFEQVWRRALVRGTTEEAPLAPVEARVDRAAVLRAASALQGAPPDALEIVFPPDERVHDGRFANNAWLLELPTTVTKLTWTNAATMSPVTAARLAVTDGDEVELALGGRKVRAPVHVVPGTADGTIALSLGWGRTGAERNAAGRGANAFALLTQASPAMATGASVRRTGGRYDLAFTQTQHGLQGRDEHVARHGTLEEYRKHAREEAEKGKKRKSPLPLYELEPKGKRSQWGMAIDMTVCTGCSACVVACQAENNVPTVGEDGVRMGRAMHWLRVDTYLTGDAHDPEVVTQPMLCQHCERAPCEYVCPVNATVHSDDGLNQMVYNRCVGTRFCSNNCPYKVRRFNWFDYHQHEPDVAQLVHNPDVTVRERGVMEKCSFCVQRIREDEIARGAGRSPPPLQTACQQACPTGAIVFGDLLAKGSEVAKKHATDRAYAALEDLGTKPRVLYLDRLKNPNPEAT